MLESANHAYQRRIAKYEPRYNKFLLHSKNYVQQYNQIYQRRTELMKPHLREQATRKWGTGVDILPQIIDIQNEQYKTTDCVIIGMIFKDLKLRGSILDEAKEGKVTGGISSTAIICSNKDNLILEDPSGRASLSGSIASFASMLVTGIVIAVKGRIDESGEFLVNDWAHYHDIQEEEESCINPLSFELIPFLSNENDKFVMIVSGLGVGSTGDNDVHDFSLHLLGEFIGGRLGDPALTQLAAHISRVIIAGNSISQGETTVVKDKYNPQKLKTSLSTPSKQFDLMLAQILNNCEVDILPGYHDPANISMPQQPLHPCIFPQSARFNSFERVTNPVEIQIDDVVILGHSGQPVNDIARQTFQVVDPSCSMVPHPNAGDLSHTCTAAGHIVTISEEEPEESHQINGGIDMELEETVVFDPKPQKLKVDLRDGNRRMDILRDTLAWGHLCPTIPDTTPCYPYAETDPFIISVDELPDIFFAGNQPSYESRLVRANNSLPVKQTRLICVPLFRNTGEVVLCNISQPGKPCFCIKLL